MMNASFSQLRYFSAIVEEGSLARASEVLHLTQPALTLSVQRLESDLGVVLFDRTGRSLRPTREGLAFYRHARALLDGMARARAELAGTATQERRRLRIGAPSMLATAFLAPVLSGFSGLDTDTRIELNQMTGDRIDRALQRGDIDLGIFGGRASVVDLAVRRIATRPMRAVVGRDHPLAERAYATWRDIFSWPLVLVPTSHRLHTNLLHLAERYRMVPDIAVETDVPRMLSGSLAGGKRLGIFIDGIAELGDGTRALPIRDDEGRPDPEHADIKISAIWRKGEALSPALEALIDRLSDPERAAGG